MSDVHALVDLLAFIEQAVAVVAQVAADGRVSLADLSSLYSLLAPAEKTIAELKDIVAEGKAIDVQGIEALVPKVVELGTAIMAAVKNLLPKKAA